jgi:high-affinity iron transporter
VRDVEGSFNALRAELLTVDEALESGAPFMFTAVNSFAIIVREGLEAVLLIGAILAYLSAIGAEKKHQRRIYMGVGAGIGGSVLTWVVARTLLPVTGASRELLEGVTALVAVGVLLYVSHWLFQKAYLHDWKQYLRERVGQAASSGSVLAMAGLAFAAVYREGFETVLFYQAMLYDAPPMAVLTGFVPGMLLILVVGFGIIRLGVKLPLRKVFGFTNAILVYLAFVFLGKGLYNLQESGMFSPLPLSWIPDSAALQQIFGLYPVAQTVIAQLALATMLIATWVIYVLRTPPATTA